MKLLPFQSADLARAACHDGAILSWDTGLGKTWATFLWPLLKVGYSKIEDGRSQMAPNSDLRSPISELRPKAAVLIVAPGDLHRQIADEGWNRFRIRVTRLDSKATFRRLCPDGRHLAPGFYLTSYHELGMNGVRPLPKPVNAGEDVSEADAAAYFEAIGLPDSQLSTLTSPLSSYLAGTRATGPGCRHEASGIRCIVDPTLADEVANVFAAVIVDEGVRVKGDYTHIAEGVRTLDPRYRLVLTATPIKNRLPDAFWLAWWATGGWAQSHARFPYAGTTAAKGDFAATFLVNERNLTKEERADAAGKRRRFQKLRAEVCNVHRLWKLFAPITLRRRKADAGVAIVPKQRHVVRVPFGRQQAATYEYHLHARYLDRNRRPATGAQLQALRVAAAHPASPLLTAQNEANRPTLPPRSALPYTPKMAAVMELIAQCLERREQVLVGCALHDPNDYLELLLAKAGVPCVKLDGRMSPGQRGEMAAQFKTWVDGAPLIPVMLAGVGCMSEGHSFDRCRNAILPAFDWAFDKFEQFINRIHRLTSREPVNVYSVITTGTVDRKLESSIAEKGDAAALVLDGCLGNEVNEELNLAALLSEAYREFAQAERTALCEQELAAGWPALRARLAQAWAEWNGNAEVRSQKSEALAA